MTHRDELKKITTLFLNFEGLKMFSLNIFLLFIIEYILFSFLLKNPPTF